MLKAVVFDLDGLIFNTEDVFIYAIERLLAPFGFQYEEGVRRQMMGQQAHVSIGILKDHYRLKGSNEEIRQQVEKEFLSALPDILQLMPGFDGLIKSIKCNGILTAVCTSSTADYAEKLLNKFGYLDSFAFIIGSEHVENGKPMPDCYLMACEQLQLLPEEVMVLEDSENGCRAAIDANTFAVAVPGRHNEGHTYHGAALIADTLGDPEILKALNISE
ncbi:MAG: hypothetical protein CMJ76_11450 [Planctomycetaceae bacterium]|nr:hypothetical protein [Planctomycetaceae bacterium]|tara:strand:+ start:51 stop:704 length:654 start_codon:yes stop_codon:yes gene_type:complete